MTFGEWRDQLLKQYALHGGASFISPNDDATYLAIGNRGLQSFTRWIHCFPVLAEPLTLVQDEPNYDVSPVFEVLSVTIDGSKLRNSHGDLGPESLSDFIARNASHATQPANKPTKWLMYGDYTIRLYPKPDQVYSNCFVDGYKEHSVLASEDDPLEFVGDRLVDLAAIWTSQLFKGPVVTSDAIFAQIQAQDARTARALQQERQGFMGRALTSFTRGAPLERVTLGSGSARGFGR